MPRNVRNWWIEATIDGRASKFAAGPQSREGGFSLTILARDAGNVVHALTVRGVAHSNGSLFLDVEPSRDSSVSVVPENSKGFAIRTVR